MMNLIQKRQQQFLDLLPQLSEQEQLLSRFIYSGLIQGEALELQSLAQNTGIKVSDLKTMLLNISKDDPSLVEYDSLGAISGYRGIGLKETCHQIRFQNNGPKTLYGWCAWDTLFFAALISSEVHIQSIDPEIQEPIQLKIVDNNIMKSSSQPIALSFLIPSKSDYQHKLQQNFCCLVHFFSNNNTAESWLKKHPQCFLLSIEEAIKWAGSRNQKFLGILSL